MNIVAQIQYSLKYGHVNTFAWSHVYQIILHGWLARSILSVAFDYSWNNSLEY